jgi:uncharacterized membrane protein YtjA (UPF0391 family)
MRGRVFYQEWFAYDGLPLIYVDRGLIERQASTGGVMLRWAVAFFMVAIVAAIFGFGDIAAAATGVAKILFYVFLILFLISLVSGITFRSRV